MTCNRTIRSLAILLAAAAAIALLAMAARASASALPPRCKTGNVTLTLAHPVAAAGNEGLTIRLRNDGGAACAIRGYPRLGLRLHGLPVKSITADGGTYFASDPGPSVVVLQPGETAKAHLSFGTVSGAGDVRASALTVSWHGAHWHKRAGLPGAPVTITNGRLAVTAWAAAGKG